VSGSRRSTENVDRNRLAFLSPRDKLRMKSKGTDFEIYCFPSFGGAFFDRHPEHEVNDVHLHLNHLAIASGLTNVRVLGLDLFLPKPTSSS